MLNLFCLGAPQIKLLTKSLSDDLTPKALALLFYLAVTGKPHSRDVLADLFWSELSNQQARTNLRYLLPELRKAVGDYLIITSQNIGFNRRQPYWLDVEWLRTMLLAKPETMRTEALQETINLYKGEFLAGFTVRNAPVYEEWVMIQRQELCTLVSQGLTQLGERYLAQRNYSAGLAATQRLLGLEPWHEAGHRLQMQLFMAGGQRGAAIAQYHQLRQKLADELGIEPAPETQKLYVQMINGELVDKGVSEPIDQAMKTRLAPSLISALAGSVEPAPRVLAPPIVRHNLPHQLTPFVGRQQEIAELCAKLLAPSNQLITLVGDGGVGKTRLALAVAQRILAFETSPTDHSHAKISQQKFPDGIWFVSLVGLQREGDALDAIATALGEALGLRFTGSGRVVKQLCDHLRHQQLLVILDNFEHLVEEADFVLDLLRSTPGLKVLVTSRRRLDFQAEILWRVEGLCVPAEEKAPGLSVEALAQEESVALFIERAQRIQHTFQLNAENRAALVRICQLVEGLPLALELAATLLRQYDCTEIAELLQTNYAVLASTQRDLPPRHRSLRTVLDASWALLTNEEAQTLAQCAVFRGGFCREAAHTVTRATVDQLDRLESKSLLHQSWPGRYTLHELVRQYAAEQLQQLPALYTQATEQHHTYYIAFLCVQGANLHIDGQAHQRIRLEHDNILEAWQRIVETMCMAAVENSLPYLVRFYRLAGYYAAGLHLCQQVAARVHREIQAESTPAQALLNVLPQLLLAQAEFCHNLGRLAEARTFIQEALMLAQQREEDALIAHSFYEMAEVERLCGQFEAAQAAAQQALTLARKIAHTSLEIACLNRLGVILMIFSDFDQANACFQAALTLLQRAPDRVLEARLLLNLGYTNFWQRQLSAALDYNQRARDLAHLFGDQRGFSLAVYQLGMVWQEIGEFGAGAGELSDGKSALL